MTYNIHEIYSSSYILENISRNKYIQMNHINEMRNKKKYLSLKNNMNIFNITILSFFYLKENVKIYKETTIVVTIIL